jgi:CRISPR-associated Cas5-like protein
MSKFITLWLSAPMMSWGASSRSKYRDTHEFPTISAINGILRASNGVTRESIMEKQDELKLIRSECDADNIDNDCIMKNDVPVTQTQYTSRYVKVTHYE